MNIKRIQVAVKYASGEKERKKIYLRNLGRLVYSFARQKSKMKNEIIHDRLENLRQTMQDDKIIKEKKDLRKIKKIFYKNYIFIDKIKLLQFVS